LSRLLINPQARAVWARTSLRIAPDTYVLVSLPPDALADAAALVAGAADFAALLLERDEVSLTITETAWGSSALRARAAGTAGPYRAVTFDVNIDLGVVGYLAPLAERLAEAGISIVPQCAFLKDHLLVRESDLGRTVRVVESLIAECGGGGSTGGE
jgi:hypothetical protein